MQIHKVNVQLNAILNGETKKLVTISLTDRRLEHLVEIINQIVSKDNIYLGEIRKKEDELKENISCLSHDLRTPLTSIRGYLQLLSSAPDEKRQEYISALSGKALRLERLIDDFYQISLLEAGQYPFYYGKVELCSLLTEILLDNYSTFSVNGIEPQIEIPDVNIYLNADRKACIRIIQNLIFNAITSTTSNVVVQLIYNTDSVQLCIKNPIATIPTEEYSKLLERFYVADISRSNGTSGQGLYIVKKLLLLMNCKNPIIEIVLHELSHAWAGSSFGIPADAFGVGVYRFLPFGAAFFSLLPYATVSADVGISVAGPLANLFAGSVALLLAISSQSSDSLYLAVCSYTLGCINLLPIPGFDGVSLHDMFPHQLKIGFGTVLCGLAANWAVLAVGYALCFLPWWVSFLIVLVLTVMAALLLPSRHSVCWARMLSTFCLLPVMIKSLGFELLAVSLPTAILNIGFCLLLSYLTAPVLLELIFVSYLYQK